MARDQGEDFQLVLTRFVLERLLYRLGRSDFRDRFILKGAMLFSLWGGTPHRVTRDIDLLGFGESTVARLVQVFQEICLIRAEVDGVGFLSESVRGNEIREEQEYDGVRITLEARLGVARIPVQVDIGFGDAITPAAEYAEYPTTLDFPAPYLRIYPRETVVAEKCQAMVYLGTELLPELCGKLGLPDNHKLGYVMAFGLPEVHYHRTVQRGPARIAWVSRQVS